MHETKVIQGGFVGPRGTVAALSLALAFTSGCINNTVNSSSIASTSANGQNGITATTPSGGTSMIVLSRVIPTNSAPATSLDLIGDGTGAIGQFCTALQTGSGNNDTGPSTCTCRFDYTKSDGSTEEFDAPTTYREQDLIRCNTTGIPSGIAYVRVKIHHTPSQTDSNEFVLNLGSGFSSVNLADSASYSKIIRYQCKDTLFIGYGFDSSIYDPIQSEDPSLTYPLNYYTTNMGSAFSYFVSTATANGTGFVCPSLPNDASQGYDLTVYSVAPDGAGSKTIYPPTGSEFDRATFYLPRQASGVFTIPLQAYVAPNTVTAVPAPSGGANTAPPPLGYGAAPVPRTSGSGEDCPDTSVAIPAGFQWVKVWLFRASLPARYSKQSAKILSAGGIACNPGKWTLAGGNTNANDPIKPDCGANGHVSGSASDLSDRVIMSANTCFSLQNDPTTCLNTSSKISGPGCVVNPATGSLFSPPSYDFASTGVALGSDVWQPRSAVYSCGNEFDPLSLCFNANDSGLTNPANPVPHDDGNLTLIDIDQGTSRYDYLFVVTPTNIMSDDFLNATAKVLPYTPYRFYTAKDCQSPDPDNPVPGDCLPSKRIGYYFKGTSVTDSGDTGTSNRIYPMCALQPI